MMAMFPPMLMVPFTLSSFVLGAPHGTSPRGSHGVNASGLNTSVLVDQGAGDVGGCQQGEDVRLQELDQDLEDGQHEGHDVRAAAGDLEADASVEDHVLRSEEHTSELQSR